ncbi:N(G),N(G)-dimethylarginine dimethylaminohydrolase 1-like [Branchiostoma lanceolatum]|uniref:N(G),N(G)-dimethylarginine dimethylaminohydrolase 1-like n=1 Tax=Branchiostoma lanceolatum TaxID=7740 RepID=UPI00345606FE
MKSLFLNKLPWLVGRIVGHAHYSRTHANFLTQRITKPCFQNFRDHLSDATCRPESAMSEGTDFNFPRYTRAIVREVPTSIRLKSEGFKDSSCVYVKRAREEHALYVQTLRDLGLEVTVLPADEGLPDGVFVEDTCVVVGDKALMTRPPMKARRKEVDSVEKCLKSLGIKTHRIYDKSAILEGGDVMFTGKEFFAGISIKSNLAGHKVLAETFPEFPVHSIPLEEPEFHLKGMVCVAAPGTLVMPRNKWGKVAWEAVCEKSEYTYKPMWVPNHCGVNCLHINGTIVHCTEEDWPKSHQVFVETMGDYQRVQRSIGELGKVEAGLTCCSVLF